jgi:hypothetical protein
MTPSRNIQNERITATKSWLWLPSMSLQKEHRLPSYNTHKIMISKIKSPWELYKAPARRRAPVTSRCNEPKPVRERKRLRSEGALGHASNTRSTPTTSKVAAADRHRSATQATDTATSTYRHTAIQEQKPPARARARHFAFRKPTWIAVDLVTSRTNYSTKNGPHPARHAAGGRAGPARHAPDGLDAHEHLPDLHH